jgi:branched-chain amino acid transport system substrate-binding protein
MRKQRWLRLIAATSAVAMLAAACGDDDDDKGDDDTTTTAPASDGSDDTTSSSAPAATGDGTLKIGYLLPQTGQLAFLGDPMIKAVEMAVEEINAGGGYNGSDVELTGVDDGTDPDVAGPAADDLINQGVDVIVGAAASGVSLAVIDKITGTPIVQCSPSNTGLQFTTYDDGGYYFRTAPPDNLQAQVLSDLIVEDGNEKVAIIARSDEYGEGFANSLYDELTNAGVEASEPILYDPEAGNYDAEAGQLAEFGPDAVAMIAFDEGGSVISSAIASDVGPDSVQWYGTDGVQSSSFYEKVDKDKPELLEGMKGTAPSAAPADGETTFRDRFEKFAPGVDTIFSGHAYDCTVVPALAALEAGDDSAQSIQAHMVSVTKDGTKCTLFKECADLIAAGEDIDYDGAAGPLDFVDAGEPGAGAYDTWHFEADGSVATDDTSIPVAG